MMKSGILCMIQHMTGVAVLLACIVNAPDAAVNENTDIWKTNENLIRRLTAEWYKTGALKRETEELYDVLATMKDLELYPVELTGLDDRQVVPFDRALEVLQKNNREIGNAIDGFIPQTIDALQIVREMIVDEPVGTMFETLERRNMQRIAEMVQVKHSIDALWMRTDSLLSTVMLKSGLTVEKKDASGPIEDEFFDLLKANLGMQSTRYFNRLAVMKNNFVKKGTPEQIGQMLRIDKERIMGYLDERKLDPAERKLDMLIECYSGHAAVAELSLLSAKIKLMKGRYLDVLRLLPAIPVTKENNRLLVLYKLQSLYALEEYAAILADTVTTDLFDLSGADLNLAVWLSIESSLALKRADVGGQFARLIERESPFALHAMHAASRLFLSGGDDTTALSVLHEAQKIKPLTENDRIAVAEIKNAIAALYYERGDYQKAAGLFYQQLNAPEMFERALSGITWCYLKTGEYEKAETVLRKLINQSPESAVGVEGILILARRYLQKARQSWGKYDYVEKERTRLEMFLERVDKIAKTDSADSKSSAISAARKRLYALLDRIGEEKVADRETIMAYYTNIDKLCTFITSHYYTGTYQETFFSRSRERMLAIIDSTLETMAKNGNHEPAVSIVSNPQIERTRIKTIVDDATIFSVLGLIDKYKWENEFVEWRKKQINRLYEAVSPDTTVSDDTIVSDDTVTSGSKKALTRKNQEGAIDSLLTYERAMNRRYSAQLKLQIERLLSGEIDSSDQCYLYYQLGELYYREENSDYTEQYEIHEKMIANGKNKKLQPKTGGENGPVEKPPVLDHVKSMRFFRSAVEKSSSSVFAGAAMYCLAWCFNDAGQIDSAYYYMKKLARTYPDNPHTPQAWMFCGEYYFDKGNLEKALESFLWVMKYPESEWFDEALYKVAWTQYRMSNPEKAISSFLALVDLGYGVLGKSILEKESMDYIAISFSEIDASGQKGLERAAAFTRKLGDMKRSCQILYRLAQVYREQGRYEIAQKTYQLLLSTYPAYEMNPQVEAEMLIVQEHTVPTEVSIEKKYDYFKKYNRKSAWALKQNDSVRTVADSISAKMLYDAAVSFHQHALQGTNDTNYQKAIMAYTDYIDRYQTWPLANECHYNLAEIRFSLGDYRAAVEEFMTVSQRYPDSKYKETAAWNAIVAAQNILKTETAGKKQEKR